MGRNPEDKTVHRFNINRKWRRILVSGCSHGHLANKAIQQQVLDFERKYKPEIRIELGDVMDTAAFRSGAKGTRDESVEVAGDQIAAVSWLERYRPTHLCWGNHDVRLQEWMESPNAVIAHAAACVWNELQTSVRKLKTKTVPYDYEHGWIEMGGMFFAHGFWYNESAVRDHAEYVGGPVCIAHLHKPEVVMGRTRNWSQSFCVGTLADIDKLSYARRRRSTSRWAHGCVFGEISDDKHQLWLASCPKGESLRFPI